jgi:PIN domain nuclease of toxin-antitoxin system
MGGVALTRVLLDTHALIWFATDNPRLGNRAKLSIERAARSAELAVSAMTFWEIALLIARERLGGQADAAIWRRDTLASGVAEIPVSGTIGIEAVRLRDLHQDPADRIIVATAIAENSALVTADHRLLDWPGQLSRIDAAR